MTSRGIVTRTPRRRKTWAGFHTKLALDGTGGPEIEDVLDASATDLGIGNYVGVTVMRVVGFIQLVSWTATAATPAWNDVRLGLCWLDQRLATATGGSGLVPRPHQNGVRETRWYQQMTLGGIEPSVVTVGLPINGDASSAYGRIDFDLHNMQKAPTADSKFCLVRTDAGTWEANTVAIQCDFDIMLALP